jgi:hypothetical protein
MFSFVLLILLFVSSIPAITTGAPCSPAQAVSGNCCSTTCPSNSETAPVSCCSISSDTPRARLLSSVPAPAVEPPIITMTRLKSAVSIDSPLQFGWHQDFYLNLDPLSLLCSRQI